MQPGTGVPVGLLGLGFGASPPALRCCTLWGPGVWVGREGGREEAAAVARGGTAHALTHAERRVQARARFLGCSGWCQLCWPSRCAAPGAAVLSSAPGSPPAAGCRCCSLAVGSVLGTRCHSAHGQRRDWAQSWLQKGEGLVLPIPSQHPWLEQMGPSSALGAVLCGHPVMGTGTQRCPVPPSVGPGRCSATVSQSEVGPLPPRTPQPVPRPRSPESLSQ